jgi:transcriptional regulator with XRE-family HTH domain
MSKKPQLRDPDLQQVLEIQRETGLGWTYVSTKSGVARSTLKNWENGKTHRPQHLTLKFALNAMGYDFKIAKK